MPTETKKSPLKLKKETAAALSYLLGPITGFYILVLDHDSFVRYHAMQSIVLSFVFVVLIIASLISIIFSPIVPLLFTTWFIIWLIAIYNATQGVAWKVPYLHRIVDKLIQ